MDKNQKIELVESLTQKFKNSSALYFTKYTGMNVDQATELRFNFKESNSEYFISKNTLTKIAIENAGLDTKLFESYLSGQIGIAYAGDDPTAPARVIKDFCKSNDCLLNFITLLIGEIKRIGTWRSSVAHLTGGQGVGGSNPLVPTSLEIYITLH